MIDAVVLVVFVVVVRVEESLDKTIGSSFDVHHLQLPSLKDSDSNFVLVRWLWRDVVLWDSPDVNISWYDLSPHLDRSLRK